MVGIEFIDENGGGPGVRLRNRIHKKSGKYVIAVSIHWITGCFIRLSKKGPTSPRFFRGRRIRAFSPWPMMERASEPPMLLRRRYIGRT